MLFLPQLLLWYLEALVRDFVVALSSSLLMHFLSVGDDAVGFDSDGHVDGDDVDELCRLKFPM